MLQANKKQVPQKSYSLEIRIDSVNQIMKNKGKVTHKKKIGDVLAKKKVTLL